MKNQDNYEVVFQGKIYNFSILEKAKNFIEKEAKVNFSKTKSCTHCDNKNCEHLKFLKACDCNCTCTNNQRIENIMRDLYVIAKTSSKKWEMITFHTLFPHLSIKNN